MDIPTMDDIEQAAQVNRILAGWLHTKAENNLSDGQFCRAALFALTGQVEAMKLQAEKVDLATSKERQALEQELARVRAALAGLETDYIADDEYGKYCEWCSAEADGGKLVHAGDCPFALAGTEEEG